MKIFLTCPWMSFDGDTFWSKPLAGTQAACYLLCRGLRELGVDSWILHDSDIDNDVLISSRNAFAHYSGQLDD
jgi:hypothetical protein